MYSCLQSIGASSPWLCSHQDEFRSIFYLPLKVRERYFPRSSKNTNTQGKWITEQCTNRNLKKKMNKLWWFLLMCIHRVNYLMCDLTSKKLKKKSRTVRGTCDLQSAFGSQGLCLLRFPVFLRSAMQTHFPALWAPLGCSSQAFLSWFPGHLCIKMSLHHHGNAPSPCNHGSSPPFLG